MAGLTVVHLSRHKTRPILHEAKELWLVSAQNSDIAMPWLGERVDVFNLIESETFKIEHDQ